MHVGSLHVERNVRIVRACRACRARLRRCEFMQMERSRLFLPRVTSRGLKRRPPADWPYFFQASGLGTNFRTSSGCDLMSGLLRRHVATVFGSSKGSATACRSGVPFVPQIMFAHGLHQATSPLRLVVGEIHAAGMETFLIPRVFLLRTIGTGAPDRYQTDRQRAQGQLVQGSRQFLKPRRIAVRNAIVCGRAR